MAQTILQATDRDIALTKKRILVIEDESLIVMMLDDILDELDYEMATDIGTLSGALEILNRDDACAQFDAAILDVNLNGEKAWPAADRLIALDIPFLLSTGASQDDTPPAYQHIPNICKPYSFSGLQAALDTLFDDTKTN